MFILSWFALMIFGLLLMIGIVVASDMWLEAKMNEE